MQDDEFFDLLYSQWAKTTGAQDQYWMPEESGVQTCIGDEPVKTEFDIFAVDEKEGRKPIAAFLSSEDADFITAVHGCLPDLIRRLGSAIDEADRLDTALDEEINRVGAQVLEILELKQIIEDLEYQLTKGEWNV